jgi:hypothetical protein
MNYHWLIILNNIAGVTYIQFPNKKRWKESKFFKFYTVIKIIFLILILPVFAVSQDLMKIILKPDVFELKFFSSLTKKVLFLSVHYFNICGLVILIIHYRRRKQITRFFKTIDEFELKVESRTKLQKMQIINTFLNFGLFSTVNLLRLFRLMRTDRLLSYLIWLILFQPHLTILSVLSFFPNFQEFIITALKEVNEHLEDYVMQKKILEKSLTKLIKIENFLAAFEKLFGHQLTLITVNCIFSITGNVSHFFGCIN